MLTGKIVPRNEVNIKPQINGIIAELFKEAGQMVQKGEVIARLTVIPDMNSLSAAQSRVRLSEINLKQAQTNFDREKALFQKNLISAEEYEKTEQALNQAKEEYAASQESLEVIRDGVSSKNATSSSTLIRSTITGLIDLTLEYQVVHVGYGSNCGTVVHGVGLDDRVTHLDGDVQDKTGNGGADQCGA